MAVSRAPEQQIGLAALAWQKGQTPVVCTGSKRLFCVDVPPSLLAGDRIDSVRHAPRREVERAPDLQDAAAEPGRFVEFNLADEPEIFDIGTRDLVQIDITMAGKVLVDGDSEEILGAAILGLNGDEVVHSILDVMYAGGGYKTISRAVHIHPTVTELIPTTLQDLRPLE